MDQSLEVCIFNREQRVWCWEGKVLRKMQISLILLNVFEKEDQIPF